MSRRRRAISRPIPKDAKFNSALVTRLVNTVMKQGNKSVAQRIVYGALDELVAKNPAINPLEVLQRAVDNAKPRLEVKARRMGGATYQVPLEVPTDRQFSLALRWLVDLADARKGIPMKEALAAEILDAYQGQGNAIRKRDEVHKMAQANKAFAHFRW
ncbi:MAG TPA: 30S ribosomal protein S7 [Verrucomicrobiota bacterium]|jgi:small subunit ribosomal protein S7|nr:30S ribosomal protein S7 [Verrucomicrobiota bacterium]OQC25263.1 MAG: 30S ribosomal protein S7 [Verrucomicrobia bacterium ADurb.Bin063]HCL91922.1 30S ribosomal protein S7 [Limisphaerales bacterium]HRR64114.1 30S ribosomal protein S7 [Candidatus Paceibacterota bacterium]MBP8014955.1 30S ribosomal protein S7 [Verrucomicrobiota bacterium]